MFVSLLEEESRFLACMPHFNKLCPDSRIFSNFLLFHVLSYREVLVLVVFLEVMAELVSWYADHYLFPRNGLDASSGGCVTALASLLPLPSNRVLLALVGQAVLLVCEVPVEILVVLGSLVSWDPG